MLKSRSLIRCLATGAYVRACFPSIFRIFTSHIINQPLTLLQHLIVTRTLDGFALKLIPTVSLMNFKTASVRNRQSIFISGYLDGEHRYQAMF